MKNDPLRAPDMQEILAHHDVVFRAPVPDPTYGLPIGNGSTGALLWTEEDTLCIRINHTDLIDDKPSDDGCCPAKDEHNNICRNGAEIALRFRCPIFGSLYQTAFEGRLALYGAAAHLRAETAFGKVRLQAICSEKYGVLALALEEETAEPLPLTCELRRWGSRSFMYWYSVYEDLPGEGLGGTGSSAEGGFFAITQALGGRTFCVMLTSVPQDGDPALRTVGAHTAEAEYPAARRRRVVWYAAVGIGADGDAARAAARERLEAAVSAGYDAIRAEHEAAWRDFWSRSYVVLPEDQDFIENLWYLNLYYANCEMKGEYPAHFCNGVWGFFHDFVPWNCYFHYNAQLATFPLEAAGHPELLETYYRFRRRQLPFGEKYAREIWGMPGAFYADVCDMYGRMAKGVKHNCTCGAQIALGMLRHYRYTGDEAFLRDSALPLLKAAGEFYLGMLREGEDGFWHVRGTQGYEGSPRMDDSITDHSMIRALFAELIKLLPEAESAPYRERLARLAPFMTADFLPGELDENGAIARGMGKGRRPKAARLLSVGINEQGERMRKTFADPKKDYYGFPDTEMAPLFPAGLTGLADRESELFRMICSSIYMHHLIRFPKGGETEHCMGWCMMPIYLARIGDAEILTEQLRQTVSGWIAYPQGFGIYTHTDREVGVLTDRFHHYTVKRRNSRETSKVRSWEFRHFDYETVPIVAAAVNEMLLQSYDGVLRLFCAVRKDTAFAFRLYAEGGFAVEAAYDRGAFAATVESRRGGRLRIAFEAVDGEIAAVSEGKEAKIAAGEVFEAGTAPGQIFRFSAGRAAFPEKPYPANADVKYCGDAKLGTEKEW